MEARGGPGRPCLTAQHAGSAGDQGAVVGAKLYCFSLHHTPVPSPKPPGCCYLGEEGVFERPGEERQGPGQKVVLRPALFCLVAAVFFSPFFGFSFLLVSCLCGDVMEAGGQI